MLLSASLLIALFFSCNNKKEGKPSKEKKPLATEQSADDKLLNNEKETARLWKAAIDSGDFDAYNKLATPYIMKERNLELYYYSLIMANKWHCPEAYYILSTILESPVPTKYMELLSNDKDTKNLALYYLFKAKELGFKNAQFEIEEMYGKGKPVPNSAFFLKRLMQGGASKRRVKPSHEPGTRYYPPG